MSIRTTLTLDEDVLERVKAESRTRGNSFKETVNDLLRIALLQAEHAPRERKLNITPFAMGYRAGLNYDSVEALLDYGEGDRHL